MTEGIEALLNVLGQLVDLVCSVPPLGNWKKKTDKSALSAENKASNKTR